MSLTLNELENYRRTYGNMDIGGSMALAPRFKFNFKLFLKVRFNESSTSIEIPRVKNVNLPDITFDTQIANQYNIKRAIQKKINYGTCNISFYDTYDSQIMNIMENYVGNYYNNRLGFRNTNDVAARNKSVISDNFQTNMGYSLTDLERRYYFEEIQLIQYGGQDTRNRTTTLYNPIINSFSIDAFDYGDSQPVLLNFVFQPEYVGVVDNRVG